MNRKAKGSNAERELVHLFWKTGNWTACRIAGSGSMKYPSPDIIANKKGMNLAIECKISGSNYQLFSAEEITALQSYALRAGARPLLAIKFSKQPWRFVNPEDLTKTPKNYSIQQQKLELNGLTFEELIESHKD